MAGYAPRERPGRAHRPGGPPFDLVRSKLLQPLTRGTRPRYQRRP